MSLLYPFLFCGLCSNFICFCVCSSLGLSVYTLSFCLRWLLSCQCLFLFRDVSTCSVSRRFLSFLFRDVSTRSVSRCSCVLLCCVICVLSLVAAPFDRLFFSLWLQLLTQCKAIKSVRPSSHPPHYRPPLLRGGLSSFEGVPHFL